MYSGLEHMKSSIALVGESIKKQGLPKHFVPYVFAVTSRGRVAQGACEILEILPHEHILIEDVAGIPANENKKIYIVTLT
jgi:hypothetical protein